MTNKEFKQDIKNRYKGIHWINKTKRWQACIKIKGIKTYIGTFSKLIDTVDAYDKKAVELLGEKAILNKDLIKNGSLNPIENNQFDELTNIKPNNIQTDSLENENWKDVPNYEGLYMASNLGRVRSLNRKIPSKKKGYTYLIVDGKILSPKIDRNGYLEIVLCKNTKRGYFKVHQVIGKTFIPNPNNYAEIHHKNQNRKDNTIENLMWVTNQKNQFYKHLDNHKEHKHIEKRNVTIACSTSRASKLDVNKVIEIRNLYSTGNYTQNQIGKMFNISGSCVSNVVNYQRWRLV